MTTGFSSSDQATTEQDQHNEAVDIERQTAADSEATPPVEPAEDWQGKYQELHDQHLRLAADFENFRKRVATDREALLKYGSQNTIDQLLPVLDNLQRAADSLSEASEPKMLYQSFNMLSVQLLDTLSAVGLKKIQTQGQAFDPTFHEAVQQIPSAEVPENHIVHEQQAGYMLHDRVLRPAQVIVAMTTEPEDGASKPFNSNVNTDNPFAGSDAPETMA